jgi:hypothetical protein
MAGSGGRMILKPPATGGHNVHHVVAVTAAKRAMFLPISIQRVCIRKLQNNHCNGVEALPLRQRRILRPRHGRGIDAQ